VRPALVNLYLLRTMKAKFKCDRTIDYGNQKVAELSVVTDGSEENKHFSKHTPQGTLSITLDQEAMVDFFKPQEEYILDFTVAE